MHVITVPVTLEHLKIARKAQRGGLPLCNHCLVAIALKEALPKALEVEAVGPCACRLVDVTGLVFIGTPETHKDINTLYKLVFRYDHDLDDLIDTLLPCEITFSLESVK